jgi:hypothetical protein
MSRAIVFLLVLFVALCLGGIYYWFEQRENR